MNLTRMLAIARKELLQLRRDPRSLLLAFLLPALLIALFGYAISFDVDDVSMVVLDEDQSRESRELVDALVSSGYFTNKANVSSPADLSAAIDRGTAQLAVHIPPDYSRRSAYGPVSVQAVVDGSDANTATIIIGYLNGVFASVNQSASIEMARSAQTFRPRVWFNEELESTVSIVPGLVAVVMMIVAALLTSLTVAREWERGTMEQLASTPVTRSEIIVGKLIPYVGVGVIDVLLVTGLGVAVFNVPLRGSLLLFSVLTLLFILGALGLGIFISAAARSQLLATQLAMVATFLPAFLLSGFMFAIEVMPRPLQLFTYLVPARYFVAATRGIFLKGSGPAVLAPEALFMMAFAVVGVSMAIAVFHKRLT